MGNAQFGNFNSDQIQKLYARFKQIDRDGSGELDPKEIFNVPELANNPLVQRVITIFDTDGNGKISFKEFLTGLAELYGGNQQTKLKFAFRIYDVDGDGFITNGELYHILKMMVGGSLTEIQLQQLVDRTIVRADLDFDGKISYQEFRHMIKDVNIMGKITVGKI